MGPDLFQRFGSLNMKKSWNELKLEPGLDYCETLALQLSHQSKGNTTELQLSEANNCLGLYLGGTGQ